MHPHHDLSARTRRNLQLLREGLSTLDVGGTASAKFISPRYGAYAVDGTVIQSASDPHIAGFFLGSARGPAAELHALQPTDELPKVVSNTAPHHGSLVRAALRNDGHGDFVITGVALSSTQRQGLTLASWFLDSAYVVAVEVIGEASALGMVVPAALDAVEASPLAGQTEITDP